MMLPDEKIKNMTVEELEDIFRSNTPMLSAFAEKALKEILERAYMYEDLEF